MSRLIPGFEPRAEQLELAAAAAEAIDGGGCLMAEAGTGTGKTLAYLVPAVLSGKKVVVSTATRHLQEQAASTAVMLCGLVPDRTCAVMKGRANYLCRRRLDLAPGLTADGSLRSVLSWAATTEDGDRAGCALVPEDDPVWGPLVSDAEDCRSFKCPARRRCFNEAARRRAAGADVVIVNHHLFFSDLALRAAGIKGVLPDFQAAIFDEAHAVEGIAAAAFSRSVDCREVASLMASTVALGRPRSAARRRLKAAADAAAGAADALLASFGAAGSGRRNQIRFDASNLPPEVPAMLLSLDDALAGVLGEINIAAPSCADPDEAEAVAGRVASTRENAAFVFEARAGGFVFYREGNGRHAAARAVPLEPGSILERHLHGLFETEVFTSATLAAGGSMEYSASRLGLGGCARTDLLLKPAFDYRRQACLYAPTGLPDPNDPGFAAAALSEIGRLADLTGGRAFVLCTSRRNMDLFHDALKDRLPYEIYRQGDLPKGEILARFRGGRAGVLFATASFWEGVDVPGEALSLVIMDRIPFSPQDEPVTQATMEMLRERGADPFVTYQLPRAALALKQGFGRLIRTSTDRGIVAVLDSRLANKGYGRFIIGSLPDLRVFGEFAPVARWWAAGAGGK